MEFLIIEEVLARSLIKPTKATTVLVGIPDPELHIHGVAEQILDKKLQ